MAFDIVHRVGIDDTGVSQGFRRVEAQASSSGQRVGDALERQTAGARKLTGAVGSTVGMYTQMLGVVGTVAAAFGGAIALAERWERIERAKATALREQRESVGAIARDSRVASAAFGGAGGSGSAGLEAQITGIRAEEERRRSELWDALGANGWTREDSETFDRLTTEFASERDRQIREANTAARFDAQFGRREAEAATMGAQGRGETSAIMRESIESDKRITSLQRRLRLSASEQEKSEIRTLMDLENVRHRAEVENIRKAWRLKAEAHAEDQRRAREAMEREHRAARFSAGQEADALGAAILRARGADEAAAALELESRQRERINRIMNNPSLTGAERLTLLDRTRQLFGLERQALAADGGRDGAPGAEGRALLGTRGAGGGTLSSVFGGGRDPAQVEREKQTRLQTDQLSTLQAIGRAVEVLKNAGRAGLAVLG